ncbi:ead/Ea22-like family protein [Escherichia coli]|uniref:ead/Ea22-like family protein n=1 Tax=Escherichia coli TaxID=562 RepID=UPI00211396F0|nr:ead/Ea22-like family protein [Escherichia coli]
MSKIDYQVLREAAEKATWGDWDSYKPHRGARGYEVRLSSQAIAQHVLKNNAEFIAAFNPKIALALLDERDALNERLAELEADLAGLAEDHQKATESIKQADAAVKLAHEKFSALAAENAMLKQRTQQLIDIISNTDNDYCMCGSAMKDHVHSGCGYPTGMFDYYYNQWLESDNKTPATDAFLAEVRAQCLNAFIQHHSAELDAHIKNGGEQFDEKSVRIRDIIVSARLFREQIRKGAAL